jgi:ribosomal protein L7/L12
VNGSGFDRWMMRAALGLSVLLGGAALVAGEPLRAAVWAAAAAFWVWRIRVRATLAAERPTHADEDWARGVLAAAGHPEGVRAVKALRDAEPGLSLVSAKQLADRVR